MVGHADGDARAVFAVMREHVRNFLVVDDGLCE
jgi:hypothetical protein